MKIPNAFIIVFLFLCAMPAAFATIEPHSTTQTSIKPRLTSKQTINNAYEQWTSRRLWKKSRNPLSGQDTNQKSKLAYIFGVSSAIVTFLLIPLFWFIVTSLEFLIPMLAILGFALSIGALLKAKKLTTKEAKIGRILGYIALGPYLIGIIYIILVILFAWVDWQPVI